MREVEECILNLLSNFDWSSSYIYQHTYKYIFYDEPKIHYNMSQFFEVKG